MAHTARVLGIAGAGRGTGVTHFALQAANYLCSCRQKKTAVIQWDPQGDLEKIRAFLSAAGKEGGSSLKEKDHFRLLGVDYYCEGTPTVLAACMEKDYQEILIDFGEIKEEIFPEWLRCTKKVLVADLSEWKLEAFLGMDLYDCFWQRGHKKRNRTAVSHFPKADPTFSRCLFSGYSDHGMVCAYI